jgi:hypothetical protein
MINELEIMWKEPVVAKFEALFWHLPEWTNKNQKTSLAITGLWTGIRTQDFLNTKQKMVITLVQR